MRRIVYGLMLAGVMLPGLAGAQDGQDRRPDNPRNRAEQRGEPPVEGARHRPAEPRQAQPPQPQLPQHSQGQQPQASQQRPTFNGDGGRSERRGGAPAFQPQQQPQGQQQQFDRRGFGQPGAPGQGGGYRGNGGPQVAPGSGGYRPQPGQPGFGGRPNGGPPIAPGSGGYRPQPGQFGFNRGRPGPGGQFRPAPPPPARGGGWDRGWRGDGRFDYRGYRTQNNGLFRLPRYYAPGGWGYGYRRFSPGFTIASVLFEQEYWIDDPYAYRLPPAWGPYRWVRYYNDALLVDLRSGYVVDTVYGIFW